jgi:hypothetical protein
LNRYRFSLSNYPVDIPIPIDVISFEDTHWSALRERRRRGRGFLPETGEFHV